MITLSSALTQGTEQLAASCVTPSPHLDASLLLMKATGHSRTQLYTKGQEPLNEHVYQSYKAYIHRRCQSEPVAYITGKREFYGKEFSVDSSVLIPRPDSEILLEVAAQSIVDIAHPTVLDLCTGSGCLGISLSSCYPHCEVVLSDVSPKALQIARKNCIDILNKELEVIQSDLFTSLAHRMFHTIMTNPPYISTVWYDHLSEDVKKEPLLALISDGELGIGCIRRIIEHSPSHLHTGGTLCIECDYRQIEIIREYMSMHGFDQIQTHCDLSGLGRVVSGSLVCMKS